MNAAIRIIARLITSVATLAIINYTIGAVVGWAMATIMFLVAMLASDAVARALTDERIDAGLATARGWFTAAKNAAAEPAKPAKAAA